MNLDRYEKIDGWHALERLKNNERVTREVDGMFFEFERTADSVFETITGEKDFDISDIVLNEFLESNWYIPKPFDVRQEMFDRPNEWVGAFKQGEYWFKVGFDRTEYCAVLTALTYDVKVDVSLDKVHTVCSDRFEKCIPIEDVPEEATL